jgi:hypothetical protein
MENQDLQNTPIEAQDTSQQSIQEPLPNATAILVLGILSIVICCIFGIVMGIIALILASKAKQLYEANPGMYTESSFNNMKAGRICAIIGLILSALVTLYYIIVFVIFGTAFSLVPWEMIEY